MTNIDLDYRAAGVRLRSTAMLFPKVCSVVVITITFTVFTSYALHLPTLRQVLVHCPQMLPNTALCLSLLATALWLKASNEEHSSKQSQMGSSIALTFVLCISSLSLAKQFLCLLPEMDTHGLGITQGIFARLEPFSTITAVTLVLLSGYLLFIHRWPTPARICVVIGGLTSLCGVATYVYVHQLPAEVPANSPALLTAASLVLACLGCLVIRPTETILYVLSGSDANVANLRLLAAGVIGFPILLGRMVMSGLYRHLYDERFAFAAFALLLTPAMIGLLWWAARLARVAHVEHLAAENHRAQHFSELEQKNEELQQSLAVADQAVRAKEEFLSIVSHELRTPLHGILSAATLLRVGPSREDQNELTEIVLESGEALLHIVEDLMELAHLRSGEWNLRPACFDIRDVVMRVSDFVGPLLERKGLQWSTTVHERVPSNIIGDDGRLQQIITRFVLNSIKFTDEGGVSLSIDAMSDGQLTSLLHVQVTDTGIGIAEDTKDKLFQPFSQIDASSTRKHGGLGIGLALCKEVITRMKGQVGADSLARGSLFWCTVPFRVLEDFNGPELDHV